MKGFPTDLLSRACRVFLTLAYPGGEETIPPAKRLFLDLDVHANLEAVLVAPVCQPIALANGQLRGYAIRLGSAGYPHLKLQIVDCNQRGTWVFSVDTHDAIRLDATHADARRLEQLQAANRRLKEQIEHAWEADGLLTFNGLLRRELDESSKASDKPS